MAKRINADEWNNKFLGWKGFNEAGYTWAVIGDTFSIKDIIKENGGKWLAPLKCWVFNHFPEYNFLRGYNILQLNIDDVFSKAADGKYHEHEMSSSIESLLKGIEDMKMQINRTKISEKNLDYIGTIGERLSVTVALKRYFISSTRFGACFNYLFEDENGNVIKWLTSSCALSNLFEAKTIDPESFFTLEGIVKAHSEYKGIPNTVLKNCKFYL